MRTNTFLEKLSNGEVATGSWLIMGSPVAAEIFAQGDYYDTAVMDMQHGYWHENTLLQGMQIFLNTSTVPIARVVRNEVGYISRALDMGAMGVIIPLVNSREEAEAAVAAMRPPPEGERSLGGSRLLYYGDDAFLAESCRQIACIVMIETKEAVERAEEILSVPGVDCGFVGPGDLAISMGCYPERGPVHEEALRKIVEAGRKAGTPTGILCRSPEEVKHMADLGFQYLPQFGELRALKEAAEENAKAIREALAGHRVK
jgi:2-keto-3-deoxy-L-rhamnonate aldolase RhmA